MDFYMKKNSNYNTTQLHFKKFSRNIHRDYIAHVFRWAFARRFIFKGSDILDIGCGQDLPLLNLLRSGAYLRNTPNRYVGIDFNKIRLENKLICKWSTIYDNTDIFNFNIKILNKFDVIICYEVLEHMKEDDGKKLLKIVKKLLKNDGLFIFSTPVFNFKSKAKNHIYEYTIEELKLIFKKLNFFILKRYGTFASYSEIKNIYTNNELFIIKKLKEYYDDDIISIIFAPLYPDYSRNNTWILSLSKNNNKFSKNIFIKNSFFKLKKDIYE